MYLPPPLLRATLLLLLLTAGCRNAGDRREAAPAEAAGDGRLGFTEITAEAGLGDFRHETGAAGDLWMPETMGSGAGFIDYDGDGWQDVLLVGGGAWGARAAAVQALRLYRNRGDGSFTERTREAGLAGLAVYGMGLTAADYDNDGDQDFFFTTLAENMLFRNDGGRFTEVGAAAGVAGRSEWSTAAVFFDADRDGWLDLFVGGYVDWSPEQDVRCSLDGETKSYCTPEVYEGVPSRFYRNDGDGTFTERTEAAGFAVPAPGMTLGAAELDFDRDGWPDLAVANDLRRNLLFRNDGDGTFTERGLPAGIAYDEYGRARAGMGIDAGVVDDTGEETIFIGNFSDEMIGVYRHAGEGAFVDRGAASGIGMPSLPTLTFGLFLFDADLDADLDLFVANGHVHTDVARTQSRTTYRQPAQLFLNRGDGLFDERGASTSPVFATPLVARGAAYADFDRDGDLDVLLTENGGPARLWRNDLDPEHGPLRVRLVGRTSNRDGIGARLVAVAGGRRLERRIRTGFSYLSHSETVATFGLGGAARVDSLLVYWPAGTTQRFAGLEADHEIVIREGEDGWTNGERAPD